MPHGTPDWGLVGPKATVYGLDDLGEHAVRLGSPHMWDRRGDTILLDTFEHGLGQVYPRLSGLNAAVALEGGHAWWGAFCAKLTTGSDDERRAGLGYRHGYPVAAGLGLEFTFTIPVPEEEDEGTTAYWHWRIAWRTAVGLQTGQVRYDFRAWTLEYLDVDGNWEEFADDVRHLRDSTVWHTGKLVVDYVLNQYVRFILNHQWWPLPNLATRLEGVGGLPFIEFELRLEGQDDENQVGYVDSVVITQNEP